jgi:chromosome segregation ATPase
VDYDKIIPLVSELEAQSLHQSRALAVLENRVSDAHSLLIALEDRLAASDAAVSVVTADASKLQDWLDRLSAGVERSSRESRAFVEALVARVSRLERQCGAMPEAVHRIDGDLTRLTRETAVVGRLDGDVAALKRGMKSVRQSVAESQGNISRLQATVKRLPVQRLETEIARLAANANASEDNHRRLQPGDSRPLPSSVSRTAIVFFQIDGQLKSIQVNLLELVTDLKRRISKKFGFSVESQSFRYGPHGLNDSQSLQEYGITANATLDLRLWHPSN